MNRIQHAHAREVVNRLARAEGHVRAIRRMVEEGRPCPDVLVQIAAVRQALFNAAKLVLEDHIQGCISESVERGDAVDALQELRAALSRFMS